MSDEKYDITEGSERIRWVSEWLDREIPLSARVPLEGGGEHMDAMTLDMARLIKLSEEVGEVVTNFIGFRALNPRKGQTVLQESDIIDELYDVAFTALAAAEHFHGNSGIALGLFLRKAAQVKARLEAHDA